MKLTLFFNNFFSSLSAYPYSKLYFITDGAKWVLDWELHEVSRIAEKFGISTAITQGAGVVRQAIFYSDKFILLKPRLFLSGSGKVAFPYFHGYPTSGTHVFTECLQNLKKYHHKVTRIQTSHTYMKNIILESGIDSGKVFLIPIAINNGFFQQQTDRSKKENRELYGIPQEAVVIGSFQKDGSGWGEGLKPKLIKGPDIFLESIKILRESVPELFVLLSGPARGYIKKGLEALGVPFKHIYLEHYPDICHLYQCLDLYIVASREEGGPKAVLESMACGIPLVTTRVGQAMDLVDHGVNGIMVAPEDIEGIAYWSQKALSDSHLKSQVIRNGIVTAANNTYDAHQPLWKKFFMGFAYENEF